MSLLNLLLLLFVFPLCRLEEQEAKTSETLDAVQIYQKLLKLKRAEQLDAVKTLVSVKDYNKQYRLAKSMLEAIKKVLHTARVIIESSDFIPGGPFPTLEGTKEALSHILENTALFSDIALRLPQISDIFYKKDNEFRVLIEWAISFSNSTGFYDPTTTKLMYLIGQELNLVERDADYVNPNRKKVQPPPPLEQAKDEKSKKAKPKSKGGPRLSKKKEL